MWKEHKVILKFASLILSPKRFVIYFAKFKWPSSSEPCIPSCNVWNETISPFGISTQVWTCLITWCTFQWIFNNLVWQNHAWTGHSVTIRHCFSYSVFYRLHKLFSQYDYWPVSNIMYFLFMVPVSGCSIGVLNSSVSHHLGHLVLTGYHKIIGMDLSCRHLQAEKKICKMSTLNF